jgi:hypothetical protein
MSSFLLKSNKTTVDNFEYYLYFKLKYDDNYTLRYINVIYIFLK